MLNLQKRINTIFDYLYASSAIKNTENMAYEFSKLLHTGIYIESVKNIKPAFKNFLPLQTNSLFEETEGSDFIRTCFSEMNISWRLYNEDNSIKFSDKDISYICSVFNDLELSNKNIDIIGDSLEIFRNYSIKSLGGQFFTDSKVTALALDILDYNAAKGDTFIDICSGTGGFLLAAINKILNNLETKQNAAKAEMLIRKNIFGKEIDETVRQAANRNIQARTGLLEELVTQADSLNISESEYNKYDCIATNPPFGTKTTIVDDTILKNFELAHKNNSSKTCPTPPDILFLEQNIKLLKPKTGKMAIVLPYQIVSGPKTAYIRKWILENCKIVAVIDLPSETFQPHTGTKTCLMVLEKYENSKIIDNLDYDFFISKPKWIGHDRRGLPLYKRNPDGSESEEILCDFNVVLSDWNLHLHNRLENSSISKTIKIKKVLNDEAYRLNALVYMDESDSYEKNKGIELKNLVFNIFYPGRFKRNYTTAGFNNVPFLGGANITEMIVSTKKYISKNDPHYEQLAVKEGWILITRSGTTGIVSIVPKAWDGFAISEHVIRIIPDESKENPNFLYAFLQSEVAKKQLSKQVFGSVIDEISPDAVGKLIVPSIPEERKENICKYIQKYKQSLNESVEAFNNAQLISNKVF